MGYPVRLVNDVTSGCGVDNRLQAVSPDATGTARQNEDRLRELMVRYQQGEAAAVETLVANLSPALLRFCSGPGMSRSDAEDLLQDCWLRIHRARHTYLPSEPLLPWIFAVARHTRLDAYRRRRQRGSREVLVAVSPEPASATPAPESDVMDLVNRLPDAQREVDCDAESGGHEPGGSCASYLLHSGSDQAEGAPGLCRASPHAGGRRVRLKRIIYGGTTINRRED